MPVYDSFEDAVLLIVYFHLLQMLEKCKKLLQGMQDVSDAMRQI